MSVAEQNAPNDYEIIDESGLFDRGFYLRTNPDVAEASLDPLTHFCEYGWRESRDPAPYFSLRFYRRSTSTERVKGNPFVHYILEGRAKGYRGRPEAIGPIEPIPMIRAAQWSGLTPRVDAAGLDIIVPVYRGLRDTAACIYSVLTAKVGTPFRLVVVNDRSPEPEVGRLLAALARRGLLLCLENAENMGFVATANRGMAIDAASHKLLLNSDTIVYDGWLDRICVHAEKEHVGTVTPLSNNATIFSYPDTNATNNYSLELPMAHLDRLVAIVNKGRSMDVPTGVGFCMLIHRDCYRDVGELDVGTFARGYGEENDFCVRAQQRGWKNVAATDVLVRHTGEVSFALDAATQQKASYISLLKKHPRYQGTINRFLSRDPLKVVRRRLDLARLAVVLNREKVLLLISHNQGGGIETHLQELGQLLGEEFGILVLTPHAAKQGEFSLNLLKSPLYLPNLAGLNESELLSALNVLIRDKRGSVVHLHSAVGFGIKRLTSTLRALKGWGVRIVSTIHDYSPICPRNHLIDDSDDYCGLPGPVDCNACAASGFVIGKAAEFSNIASYRAAYRELLACAERTFVPSEDARTRLQPYLPGSPIEAKPHLEPAVNPPRRGRRRLGSVLRPVGPLRVVLIGAIGPHKGSAVLFGCASDALGRGLDLEFGLVGYSDIDERLRQVGVEITGPYVSRDDLHAKIESYAPDVAFFPSIWPETYLYTLSEAFNGGIFPVAFDLGAPAERIIEAGWGALIDFDERYNFSFINDSLLELRAERTHRSPLVQRRTEEPAQYYGYPPQAMSGKRTQTPGVIEGDS